MTVPKHLVKSAELLFSFTASQLTNYFVQIISAFNELLLVSRVRSSQLFILSWDGRYLSNITIDDNDSLVDAIWTPRRNIAYTSLHFNGNGRVVVMTAFGKGILNSQSPLACPLWLSAFNDTVYLVDCTGRVRHSPDDGVSWILLFEPIDEWHCRKLAISSTDLTNDLWMLESRNPTDNERDRVNLLLGNLRIHSFNKTLQYNRYLSSRKVTFNSTAGSKQIDLTFSDLTHDGGLTIFLSDYHNKTIHLFSINGQYHRQLLSSTHIRSMPTRIVVDSERRLMYVAQYDGLVSVFSLSYDVM